MLSGIDKAEWLCYFLSILLIFLFFFPLTLTWGGLVEHEKALFL